MLNHLLMNQPSLPQYWHVWQLSAHPLFYLWKQDPRSQNAWTYLIFYYSLNRIQLIIGSEYLYWFRNWVHHLKSWNKTFKPYSLNGNFITSYKLCLYSWRTYKSLFYIFPRYRPTCMCKHISVSGFSIIWHLAKSKSKYPTHGDH